MYYLSKSRSLIRIISITWLAAGFLFLASMPIFASPVNFKYLNSRMKTVNTSDGKKITIWETTDRKLQTEKIAASTEEIALVTRAYLKHYEKYDSSDSLERAKKGLAFLLHMQAKDGTFHAYLTESGNFLQKNDEKSPSLNEPTAEAFLTLVEGTAALRKTDTGEYRRVENAARQVIQKIDLELKKPENAPGNYRTFCKMRIPAWLVEGRGDLTAMYLLGISRLQAVSPDPGAAAIADRLGLAIIEFKCSEPDEFPRYVHLTYSENPYIWKTRNYFQTAALAASSSIFHRQSWLRDAETAAAGFLTHLPASFGPMDGFYPHPSIYPQTPAAAYALTINFNALARATGEEKYAKLAGLCAGWFMKNNPADRPMYSPTEGHCFLEIRERGIIEEKNLASTAYALLSLLEVQGEKGQNYLTYTAKKRHTFTVFESELGKPVHTDFEITDWPYPYGEKGQVVIIRRQNTFWHKFDVMNKDDYFMLLCFQRQQFYSSAVAVNVRVDGGPILLVPLGGAQTDPYMIMKTVTDPVPMLPGPHTVGVRYKGMLNTLPAIIDCIVMQPTLEYVHFVGDRGQNLLLMKNWRKDNKRVHIPPILQNLAKVNYSGRGLNGENSDSPFITHKGKKWFMMPNEGFGIFEW